MLDQIKIKKPTKSINDLISKQGLCGKNSNRESAYNHLIIQWINVEKVIKDLGQIIGSSLHISDVPVIVYILRSALDAYDNSISNVSHYSPHVHLNKFISVLMKQSYKHCNILVVCSVNNEEWSVFSDETLSKWDVLNETLLLKDSNASEKEFCTALYKKIILNNMQQVMKRFNHGKSFLAHDMGYSN